MTGPDIIKIARAKHIEERDKNYELNAMRFIVQYQNGKLIFINLFPHLSILLKILIWKKLLWCK